MCVCGGGGGGGGGGAFGPTIPFGLSGGSNPSIKNRTWEFIGIAKEEN